MDPNTWQKSNRTGFLYSFTLNNVLQICVANIIGYSLAPFGRQLVTDSHFMTVVATTVALSVVAFFIAEVFINQLMGQLCEKGGLFGKDLNKVGDQATKEKV